MRKYVYSPSVCFIKAVLLINTWRYVLKHAKPVPESVINILRITVSIVRKSVENAQKLVATSDKSFINNLPQYSYGLTKEELSAVYEWSENFRPFVLIVLHVLCLL